MTHEEHMTDWWHVGLDIELYYVSADSIEANCGEIQNGAVTWETCMSISIMLFCFNMYLMASCWGLSDDPL